jgi:hypothetical protein
MQPRAISLNVAFGVDLTRSQRASGTVGPVHPARNAYARFLVFSARTGAEGKERKGSMAVDRDPSQMGGHRPYGLRLLERPQSTYCLLLQIAAVNVASGTAGRRRPARPKGKGSARRRIA